jgi:hypothetical protein
MTEPLVNITDPEEQKLLIGGEVCMWGETVDASDILQTIWPRAAAAAGMCTTNFSTHKVSKSQSFTSNTAAGHTGDTSLLRLSFFLAGEEKPHSFVSDVENLRVQKLTTCFCRLTNFMNFWNSIKFSTLR